MEGTSACVLVDEAGSCLSGGPDHVRETLKYLTAQYREMNSTTGVNMYRAEATMNN